MRVMRSLMRGLRSLLAPAATEQDLTDELQDYVERSAAAREAAGVAPDEAYRTARVELGSRTAVVEQVRSGGWEHAIALAVADLRVAARRMRSRPTATAVIVLTLATGIGASTAIYSAIQPVLLRSLPYPHPDRLVVIWESSATGGHLSNTFGAFDYVREHSQSFEAMAAYKAWQPALVGAMEPERVNGQAVTATYFRTLGVAPELGQDFQSTDDHTGGARLVVLSDGLWRRRFGADPSIVGRVIQLDGESYTVTAVMPRGFRSVLAPEADVWTLLQYELSEGRAWGHHLRVVGRLRAGIPPASANSELAPFGPGITALAAAANGFFPGHFLVVPVQDEITRDVRPSLMVIGGAALLLLCIACVNVTSLLLAAGAQRRGEVALRIALGARRGRIIRQQLTESLLLSLAGGSLGLAVASVSVRAVVAMSPAQLPRADAIHVDRFAYLFALGVTLIVGVLTGLVPALRSSDTGPNDDLQNASRRSSPSPQHLRRALVVAEVSLALVLLIGSGLLFRSLQRFFAVDSGFDAPGVLTMQVITAGHQFDAEGATARFYEQAKQRVAQLPGVISVGFTSQLPLSGDVDEYGIHFEGTPSLAEATFSGSRYAITPGYLETLRIPLKAGRTFTDADRAGAPRVALLSAAAAQQRFAGADPIGQRLRIGPATSEPYTVVGVVGDVRQVSLGSPIGAAVYVPESQWPYGDRAMSLVVRTHSDPTALITSVRRAIWSVDKDQPIVRISRMDQLVAESAAERRFVLRLTGAFALAALFLAAAGIYGVLAGAVVERRRELGIRAALGASDQRIVAFVLRDGMLLTGLGTLLGVAGAVAASRLLTALLFGVSRLDPLTYAAVTVLLIAVAALSSVVPAMRAARVDPAITLRSE